MPPKTAYSKDTGTSCVNCTMNCYTCCFTTHSLFLIVVQVNFTTSLTISVTEGDVVRLRGEAFGIYANEVAIGVECLAAFATDVEPGMDTKSVTDASMLLVRVV